MDPNTNSPTPSFDLPRPAPMEGQPGVSPNIPVPETNQQTEQNNMELPGAAAPAPPAQPVVGQPAPVAPAQMPQAVPAAPALQPAPVAADPLTAEDNDLIEKAWVQKAKAIVEHTKNDPYKQNNEINKVKASYIKKRYNKDIKIADEQTP